MEFLIKRPLNPRDTAVFVLLNVNENGRKANVFLRETLDKNERMDVRDKSLTEHITVGTLSCMYSIDEVLSQYSKTPVSKLNPYIREILRTAVYQILYMDRIPASAAINEAVELSKIHGLAGLSGFVNGVLRAVSKDSEKLGAKEDTRLKRVLREGPVRYSVPVWLYKKMCEDFGVNGAEGIFEAWNILRKTSVRFNTSKASEEDILKSIVSQEIKAVKVEADPPVYELEGLSGIGVMGIDAFNSGLITVQDASAALLGPAASPKEGDFIVDLCASPGGKSLLMADLTKDKAEIIARDVSEQKTGLIDENVRRCGFSSIKTEVRDALILDKELVGKADLVIADLPCSGLGVVAKKPDIKKKLTPESITELVNLQREILRNAVRYVKPGGRLVYSTCTVTKEENEQNAMWIADKLGLKMISSRRINPDAHHDGFYIASFLKNE